MTTSRGEDGMLAAMLALYRGDEDEAYRSLPPDDQLSAHEAATFGRIDRLRELIDADPLRVNEWSPDGFSPLHGAIYGGHEATVQLLLDRGADPNVRSTSEIARVPPLGTAAFVRRSDLAALLIDAGADVNGGGDGGFTALDSAVQNGDEEMIRLLLARGADASLGAGIARERLQR